MVRPPEARSTATSVTPEISRTSSVTDATQWPQVIPVTVYSVVWGMVIVLRGGGESGLVRSARAARWLATPHGAWRPPQGSRPSRRRGRNGQVLVQQAERDGLQGLGHGGDLGQDVDAVGLVGDHPLDAPDLTLDPLHPP